MTDLFPPKAEPAPAAPKALGKINVRYPYLDEKRQPLFEVVRFEPKDFRQRHHAPDGSWVWGLNGVRRVLYRLPELREACASGAEVWIAEGEKDVDTLRSLGLVATCNPGGAGKWRPEFSESLKGASAVYVIPDNDKPGREHASAVAAALAETVPTVKVVALPGAKDATEWVRLCAGTVAQLADLARAAPAFSPSQSAEKSSAPISRTMKDLVLPLTAELLRATPPAREYLVYDAEGRGVLPRARVGMLGAPGGTGKSKAVVGLTVAVATGGKWFGAWQCQRGRVLLVLAEEDRAEALRRLHYALRSSGDAEIEDVARNVTLLPAAGEGLALTYEMDGASGGLPETARAAELREMLKAAAAEGRPYALVVLDPSSRFAGADVEKDNAAATRYVQVLETLTAAECGAPNVLLPAHTRKRGKDDEPGSTDALRGASGQRDGARWVAMLERRKLVDGAPKLLDFVISKTNYGPENALVLVAQDELEGALRAATDGEVEQYAAAAGSRSSGRIDRREDRLRDEVVTVLSDEPLSSRGLAEKLRRRPADVNAVIVALQTAGTIVREGGRNGVWKVLPGASRGASRNHEGGDSGASAPKGAGSGKHQKSPPGASHGNHPPECRCDGDRCGFELDEVQS